MAQQLPPEDVLARLRRVRALGAVDVNLSAAASEVLAALAQPWEQTPSPTELAAVSKVFPEYIPAALSELAAHGYLSELAEILPHLAAVRP